MWQANEKVGPYVLVKNLGEGEYGTVWMAEKQSAMGLTRYAVKLMMEENPDFEAVRWEREVWEKAGNHPNVLPVIEADNYYGRLVLVTEYIAEGSLQDWFRCCVKVPAWEDAAGLVFGLLDGLGYLHAKGIVHGALKPSNIMLQRGVPRLTDFGLFKVIDKLPASADTIGYLAPEGCAGQRSENTDLWAISVIFYRLLCGQMPFQAKDPTRLPHEIATEPPLPLPDAVPTPLRDFFLRALDKSPIRRWVTAHEMSKALENAVAQSLQKQRAARAAAGEKPGAPAGPVPSPGEDIPIKGPVWISTKSPSAASRRPRTPTTLSGDDAASSREPAAATPPAPPEAAPAKLPVSPPLVPAGPEPRPAEHTAPLPVSPEPRKPAWDFEALAPKQPVFIPLPVKKSPAPDPAEPRPTPVPLPSAPPVPAPAPPVEAPAPLPPPLVPKITPQPATQGPLYAHGERSRVRPAAPQPPAEAGRRGLGGGMALALILVGLCAAAAGIYYLGNLVTGGAPPPASQPVSPGGAPAPGAVDSTRQGPGPQNDPPVVIGVPARAPAEPPSPTPTTGRLTVRVKIDGVRVFIDEEAVGEVSSGTPLQLSLYLGPHLVRAEAPGRRPAKAEVEIVADREAILDLDLPEAAPAGEGQAAPGGR